VSKPPPLARRSPALFSIVIPVYDNEASLAELHARLIEVAGRHPEVPYEIVFVDDGSEDGSFARLEAIAASDPHVRAVQLSRNFGSHNACLAGLSVARGECAAIIGADLQDPPDLPWRMLEQWSPATPVVVASRHTRDDDGSRVLFATLYYEIMRRLAFPRLPRGGFDCFLIDRCVIDHLAAFSESNASISGMVMWTGFAFTEVTYDRLARPFGRSRWTFGKRVKLLIDSVVGFSYAPIRVMSAIGMSLGIMGFLYAGWIAFRKLTAGIEVTGWSSLMAALMVLSGVQLIALGVLGEYVWRALDAARQRPNFIIAATRNVESGRAAVPSDSTVRAS
jgi:polyisoprenyl-phosphate glycosyltransferase